MNRINAIFVVLILSAIMGATAQAVSRVDKAMLASIENNDLDKFKKIIANGYDVNGFVEDRAREWLMCDAARPGRLEFLKYAIEAGGEINRIRPKVSDGYATPLNCAISHDNKEAFDYLLAQGANPNLDVCPGCKDRFTMKPVVVALLGDNYRMAYELIAITDMTDKENEGLRKSIEDWRYFPKPSESEEEYRVKIAEYLETQGYEINMWTLEKENSGEWLNRKQRKAARLAKEAEEASKSK